MVTAIDLYHKTFMAGNEVNDIISYCMLTKEINPKSLASQMFPKILFCQCGILSILAGIFP